MKPPVFIARRIPAWIAPPLLLVVTWTASAQQTPALDKRAAAIKRKADSLKLQAPITVVYKQSAEVYGTFVSDDADSFTFYDVDHHTNVTTQFADVKKLKIGYGGYNSSNGRHVNQAGLVIGTVALTIAIAIFAAVK